MAQIEVGENGKLAPYEHKEFNSPVAQTNWSVKSNVPNAFKKVREARRIIIRTSENIIVRLNSTIYDPISISKGERVLSLDEVGIQDVFITNTGSVDLKIMLL